MSRRSRRAWTPALIALGALVASPPFIESHAHAAGTAHEGAQAAWERGRTLVSQKKWDAAADAFREADVIEPKAQYKIDLARALVGAGKMREASEALDALDSSKDASASVRDAAGKLRDKIDKRLGTIVVTLSGGGSGATLEIDGKKVRSAAPTRVDPGKHQLRASSTGWVPLEMTLEVGEGKTENVPFKLERDPGAAAAEPDVPDPEPAPPPAADGGTLLPAAVAWGVGAVGFGVGAIFGAFAFAETDKARENCVDERCTEAAREALDASKVNGGVSTAGFILGGAGLVTGIVLAVVYGSGDAAPATAAVGPIHATPWIGGTSAGVDGTF